MAEFVRRAVARQVSRKARMGETTHKYRELQIMPHGDRTVDNILDVLAHRHCTVADITHGGTELPSEFKRVLQQTLPPVQARRYIRCVALGQSPLDVAATDGCSKQAVYKSLSQAAERLRTNQAYLEALLKCFPDAGVTPEVLRLLIDSARS